MWPFNFHCLTLVQVITVGKSRGLLALLTHSLYTNAYIRAAKNTTLKQIIYMRSPFYFLRVG